MPPELIEGGSAATAAPAPAPTSASAPAPASALSGDDARYAAAFAEAGISPDPAQAAPAPAPASAAGGEGQGGDQRPPLTEAQLRERYNNLSHALREERGNRRELQAKFTELQQQIEQLRGAGQQAQPAAAPDPSQDPIGFLEHLAAQEQARNAETAAQRQQTEVHAAQTRAVQSLMNDIGERERDFALETPDYFSAVNHLRGVRAEQYKAMGYAPEVAEQLVTRDALQTSADLIRQGKNPADAWYKLALQSGYKPGAAPAPAPASASASDPGAGLPAPAPAAAAASSATEALERIRAGQEAAKSLSGSGGDAQLQPTVEHALTLRGAAFDSYFDNLAAQERASERRR